MRSLTLILLGYLVSGTCYADFRDVDKNNYQYNTNCDDGYNEESWKHRALVAPTADPSGYFEVSLLDRSTPLPGPVMVGHKRTWVDNPDGTSNFTLDLYENGQRTGIELNGVITLLDDFPTGEYTILRIITLNFPNGTTLRLGCLKIDGSAGPTS